MPYPSCVQNPSSRNAITCPLDAACWHNATTAGMSRLTSAPPLPLKRITAKAYVAFVWPLEAADVILGCAPVSPPLVNDVQVGYPFETVGPY
jgi:hypothetical protein